MCIYITVPTISIPVSLSLSLVIDEKYNQDMQQKMAPLLYSKRFLFCECLSILLVLNNFVVNLHAIGDPPLTLDYYESKCPSLLSVVRKEMECAVLSDPRNAALILRLHFHDCFVQVVF